MAQFHVQVILQLLKDVYDKRVIMVCEVKFDAKILRVYSPLKDVRASCYCAFRMILCAHFSLIPQSNAVF